MHFWNSKADDEYLCYDPEMPGIKIPALAAALYAAGDMLGAPLQVAKAVGDGLVAGLCAAEELQQLEREATV